MPKTIGVLALQGDIEKHVRMLQSLGANVINVRDPEDLSRVAALVIPGGESTTIGKLMERFGLMSPLISRIQEGMPVFGTCAGVILLSSHIENRVQQKLDALNITVARNAYGPQVESFEGDITIPLLGAPPVRAVFIRAPIIKETGPEVEILARYEERPILIRQGKILGATFHPELTDDTRIHKLFLDMIPE